MRGMLKISVCLGLTLCAAAGHAQSVFTCVDDKGRKIVADRPIPQCADRTQKEMSSSGTVKRVMGPTLTPQEQAVRDEKERELAQQQARQAEERRLDRALLLRYPRQALHNQSRMAALAQVDEVIQFSKKRALELAQSRKKLDAELARYAQDPSKTPAALKRQSDENHTQAEIQNRFIAGQEVEKERINARFDEELVRLKYLWGIAGTAASAQAASATVLPASQALPQAAPVR